MQCSSKFEEETTIELVAGRIVKAIECLCDLIRTEKEYLKWIKFLKTITNY